MTDDEDYRDYQFPDRFNRYQQRHRKKMKSNDPEKNREYVRAYRERVKSLKDTDMELYEEKVRLKRRQKRFSRKRCRAAKDPKYAFNRYRAVIRLVMRYKEHMFRGFFDQNHDDYCHYSGDLSAMIKAYRGMAREIDTDERNEVDGIREFVTLSLAYRFFLPIKSKPRKVNFTFEGQLKTINIPSLSFQELYEAQSNCVMVHDGVLYHNDWRHITNTSDFIVRRGKKPWENSYQISLDKYLSEIGYCADDLK